MTKQRKVVMPKELSSQVKICNETFKRIESSLSYIKETIDEHKKRSDERQGKLNQMFTDIEVIKTKQSNHLEHHTEIKQEFQWRTALIIGIVTFGVTFITNLVLNWDKIKTIFGGN